MSDIKLVKCPSCGKPLNPEAEVCMHCSKMDPFENILRKKFAKRRGQDETWLKIGAILIGLGSIGFIFPDAPKLGWVGFTILIILTLLPVPDYFVNMKKARVSWAKWQEYRKNNSVWVERS